MKFLRLVVSVALLAATAAGAGGVCDADADVTSWREMPYNNLHELDGSLIRVQVKLPDTNSFTEYNEIYHSATDSFLSHYYADGRMNTLLTYFTYETFDKLRCADDPAFLKQFNSVRRLRYDYIMSIFSFRYIDDNETVRGVPVDHWHYCLDGDYSQDLYFSRGDISGVFLPNKQPPMRIIEKGVSIETAVFDFIIEPYKVDTQDGLSQATNHFDCAKRGWSTGLAYSGPPQAESYSANVVMVFAHQKHSTSRQYFYDNDMKLASTRVLILPGSDYMRRFGHSYVTIVTDYNDDLQYVIDVDQGNCTVEPLSRGGSTFPFAGPWDPAPINSPTTSPGLFDLSAFNLTHSAVYRTTVRDMDVNVWADTRVNWPKPGVNSTVQVFYNSMYWLTEGSDISEKVVQRQLDPRYSRVIYLQKRRVIGLAYHTTDDESHLGQEIPEFTHVYDFRAGHPDFSQFDVSTCYNSPSQVTKLTFSVRSCYGVLMRHNPSLFEAALRKFIVDKCGIAPIRVNSIEVDANAPGHVDVHIQLLDVPPLAGNVRSRVTLEEAVRRLGLAIDQQKDIGITVNYPEGPSTIMMIHGSLRTHDKLMSSFETGHTGGTLAMVGFLMVFVGLFVAPATAYIIWKKNMSFPYLNH